MFSMTYCATLPFCYAQRKNRRSGMEKVLRINVGAENGPVATIEELGAYAGLGGLSLIHI